MATRHTFLLPISVSSVAICFPLIVQQAVLDCLHDVLCMFSLETVHHLWEWLVQKKTHWALEKIILNWLLAVKLFRNTATHNTCIWKICTGYKVFYSTLSPQKSAIFFSLFQDLLDLEEEAKSDEEEEEEEVLNSVHPIISAPPPPKKKEEKKEALPKISPQISDAKILLKLSPPKYKPTDC